MGEIVGVYYNLPEPRPASLTRPRLLRALLGRWEHRITTVVGGAGLGKTTLLAQAVAENRLAPRGEDVWIGLTAADADGDLLARDLLDAVAPGPDGGPAAGDDPPGPGAVADAIWGRYPTAVCLVVDDGHLLAAGSPGAAWLAGVVDVLPANGHLVVAGRVAPALPLGRLSTRGEVLRLSEDDLRFSPEELAGFAARRGVAVDRVGGTGGWPAMAELAASVEGDLAGDFLWEEVLEPLGPERRRVLAVLVDLGGADDDLAGAALGAPVSLAEVLDSVPLIAEGGDGWRVPHPLWRTVGSTALAPDDRRAVRRRAVAHLVADDRYDEAFTLAREGGLDDLVPEVMRAACLGPHRPPVRRMDRWLADMPAGAAGTAGAALVTGLRAAVTTPATAAEPLLAAIDLCRRADDVAGELAAIALLGRLAWWRSDTALLGGLFPRLLELEAAGEPLARALAGIGRAVVADLTGDDDDVLGHLDAIAPGVLDPAWEAMAAWLRATTLAGRGDPDGAIAVLDAIPPSPDPAFRLTVEGTRLAADWALGRVDEVVAELPSLLDRVRAAGVVQNTLVGLSQAAFASGMIGDLAAARRFLADACRVEAEVGLTAPARLALAEAAVLTAAGDEAGAARRVVAAMDGHAIGTPGDRRLWRNGLSLSYVLVPECRAAWEAAPLHGTVAQCRRLAAAVVALRERAASPDRVDAARTIADDLDRAGDLDDPARIRAGLHHRFAVELAVGLEAAGRPQGGALLEALGPAGREVVRSVAAERSRQARPARSLLAAVPAPPPHATDLGVLGPLELVRDGVPVTAGDLRRERVRALLAFLVEHRATDRGSIIAALVARPGRSGVGQQPAGDDDLPATAAGAVAARPRVGVLRPVRRPGRHAGPGRPAADRCRPLRRPPGRRSGGRGRRLPVPGPRSQPGGGRAVPGRAARRGARPRLARRAPGAGPGPVRGRRRPGRAAAGRAGRRRAGRGRRRAGGGGRPVGRGGVRGARVGGAGPGRPVGRPAGAGPGAGRRGRPGGRAVGGDPPPAPPGPGHRRLRGLGVARRKPGRVDRAARDLADPVRPSPNRVGATATHATGRPSSARSRPYRLGNGAGIRPAAQARRVRMWATRRWVGSRRT